MDNSGFRREFNQFVFVGLVLIIGSIVVLPVLLALDFIGIVLITVLIIGTVGTGNAYCKCLGRKTTPVM